MRQHCHRSVARRFTSARIRSAARRAVAEAVESRVMLSGATAAFVRSDASTQGSWGGAYGADGYDVFTQTPNLPSYAHVSVANAQRYVWDNSPADPRALQTSPGSSSRTAACEFASGSFTINVNITDGNAHQVGIYLLDWDNRGRSESVQVSDAGAGTVLDARTASGFGSGQWLVWDVSGDVTVTVMNAGPLNAVASGLMFDPIPVSGGASASFVGSDSTTAGSWVGKYGADGYSIVGGTNSLPSYAGFSVLAGAQSWTWASSTTDPRAPLASSTSANRVAATDYSATGMTLGIGFNDGNAHKVSLYVLDWDGLGRAETVTVADATTGAVLDTRSVSNFQGGQWLSWTIAGRVQVKITRTAGPNAVFSAVGFDPVVAGTNPGSATFVGNDTATQGSWPAHYGAEGYSLPGIGASLPAYATLSPATAGTQTYTWASGTSDGRAMEVSPTSTSRTAACDFAATSFSYDLNLTDGKTHQVAAYLLDWDNQGRAETVTITDAASGAVLNSQSVSSFAGGDYLVWNLSGHVKVTFTRAAGQNAVCSGLLFGPVPSATPAAASFVKADATTQGTWTGAYGTDGYSIFDGATRLPAYAQLSAGPGTASYVWAAGVSDPRALESAAGSTSRLASCDYPASGNTFSLDLNLTDSNPHAVALYMVDWDNQRRAQTVQLADANSGAVLDTRTVSNFANGQWLVWTISGHVRITLTSTAGLNPVASGIFFGAAAQTAPSAPTNLYGTVQPLPTAAMNVTLNWTASTGTVTAYHVERSTDGVANWIEVASNVQGTVYAETYPSNTKPYYRVRAEDAGLFSPYSNVVQWISNAPPAGPANVASTQSAAGDTLTWTANTEPNVVGYNIFRSTDGVTFRQLNSSLVTSTSYTDPATPAGTSAYYYVAAVNAAKQSANSLVVRSSADVVYWANSNGGDWNTPANWQGGHVPVSNEDADLTSASVIVTLGSGTAYVHNVIIASQLNVTGGAITATGAIQITGGSLLFSAGTISAAGGLAVTGGFFELSGGTLTHTTVTDTTAQHVLATNGTLDACTINCDLDAQSVTITNGVDLNGTIHINNGWNLYVGNETLSSTSGAGVISMSDGWIRPYEQAGQAVTIGAGVTVSGGGSIFASSGNPAVINDGTILANISGYPMDLWGLTFSNPAGVLKVTSNAGMAFDGNYKAGALGSMVNTGGVFDFNGTFDNTGNTLAINATVGNAVLAGTIKNGAIAESGGNALRFNGGTLDGVTLNGDLDLKVLGKNAVTIVDGLTLNGTAYLGSATGPTLTSGVLNFGSSAATGAQVLSGNGSIVFGANTTANALNNYSATLTIGPGILLHGQNGTITNEAAADAIVDEGTFTADGGGWIYVTGGAFTLGGGSMAATNGEFYVTAALNNAGVFNATSNIQLLGNYTQTSAGVMNVTLSGSQTIYMEDSGQATLGGTLNVMLAPGFQPALGSTFNVVNAKPVAGTFANIVDGNPGDGLGYTISYSTYDATLTVIAGGA